MKKETVILWALLVAALLLSGAMIYSFVSDYHHLRTSGVLPAPMHSFQDISTWRHQRPTPPTIDGIQSWMTFDYLNNQFGVPANYLSTKLSIQDAAYPNITISSLAHKRQVSVDNLLSATKDALRAFMTPPRAM